jgi:hypothetical protein
LISILNFFEVGIKGGTSRGNAMGNVYNWGDTVMAEPTTLPQKGLVFLYFSSKDPSTVIPAQTLPTMKTSVNVFNSTKPLFENLAKKFPDITSQSMLFILFVIISLPYCATEYVILIHDVIWSLLGPYDVITSDEGDEEVTWGFENNKPVLHVLLVYLFFISSSMNKI